MKTRIPRADLTMLLGLVMWPLAAARAQSIKPIIEALGLPPGALVTILQRASWTRLALDEWGNARYAGVLYGHPLELTAHVADGQLLQVELRDPAGRAVTGGITSYRTIRDSLDAMYGPHTGSYSPLVWSVARDPSRADTIEIRSWFRAFVPGATTRLAVGKISGSGLDWSCVRRRAGGLNQLPRNEPAYYEAILTRVSALRSHGASPDALRRAACGTVQVGDLRDAVLLAYGNPEDATESQNTLGLLEIWYYDGLRTVVTITNGRVTDITRHRR